MTLRKLRYFAMIVAVCLLLGGVVRRVFANRNEQSPPYSAGLVAEPQIFGEGVISTEDDEQNGVFSPDGTEYYFAKFNQYTTFPRLGILCVSRYQNHKWNEPEVLPFSGKYLDFPPRLSPDGNTLYFSSNRPIEGRPPHALKIWSVRRNSGGWAVPALLPAPINDRDGSWNWAPSITEDGTLFFASTRDGTGHPHIYRARFVNGTYLQPEKLGREINSDFNEMDPYISPDGRILVFASAGEELPTAADRPETIKGGGVRYPRADLYVSLNQDGHWTNAKHLENAVNTYADESSPSITPDGQYLFFSSDRSLFTVPTSHRLTAAEIEKSLHSVQNGHGNIYFISLKALGLRRKETSQ